MTKTNIHDELKTIDAYWQPRIVGELNGQHVKLVKFLGEFPWHHHAEEDEMFLVVRGKFRMDLPGQTLELSEGEFLVVPKKTEHRPVAETEVEVMLFEPAGTRNTGNLVNSPLTFDPAKT